MKRRLYEIISKHGGRGGIASTSRLAEVAGCSRTDIHRLAHGSEDRLSAAQKMAIASYLQNKTLHGERRLLQDDVRGLFRPINEVTTVKEKTTKRPLQPERTEEDMLTETSLDEQIYRSWNLAFDPFVGEIKSLYNHIFLTPRLEAIEKTIRHSLDKNLIVAAYGETGAGKSTILKHIMWHLDSDKFTLIRPRIGSHRRGKEGAIISYMIAKLGDEVPKNNEFLRYDQLSRLLTNTRRAGARVTVVFDEADNLSVNDLRGMIRIWKEVWLDDCQPQFGILLMGRDGLREHLLASEADEVRNRVRVLQIKAFSEKEARDYLEMKIKQAMVVKTENPLDGIFEPEAVDYLIYAQGQRYTDANRPSLLQPKAINNLAAKAMAYRYKVSVKKGTSVGLVSKKDVEAALVKQLSL